MNKKELAKVVEAILFVAGNAVTFDEIAEKLEVKVDAVKDAVQLMKDERDEDSPIQVITFKNKAQRTSNPKYAEEIANVLNPIRERALTKAALETVAIIAYKQPITRLEIENIRGVASDYAVQILLTHKLIEVVGRKDVVGKPLLFGTTDEFLKRFELQSINDLPDYDELLEQIKVISGTPQEGLYNEYDVSMEAEERVERKPEDFMPTGKTDEELMAESEEILKKTKQALKEAEIKPIEEKMAAEN